MLLNQLIQSFDEVCCSGHSGEGSHRFAGFVDHQAVRNAADLQIGKESHGGVDIPRDFGDSPSFDKDILQHFSAVSLGENNGEIDFPRVFTAQFLELNELLLAIGSRGGCKNKHQRFALSQFA